MADIKLFRLTDNKAKEVLGSTVRYEREIHALFEDNLEELLGVRWLASEYPITAESSVAKGRVDTLGIDEHNCPVIIEYKRESNQNIITQGLAYLNWLKFRQVEFEQLVKTTLGQNAPESIDWNAPRVMCIAGDFGPYDAPAIKHMTPNINLIRYVRFADDLLLLESVAVSLADATSHAKTTSRTSQVNSTRNHYELAVKPASGENRDRYDRLARFMNDLGEDVQERHLRQYIAFMRLKTIARVWFRPRDIWLDLNLDRSIFKNEGNYIRYIGNKGHFGICDARITIKSNEDFERAKEFISNSYSRS